MRVPLSNLGLFVFVSGLLGISVVLGFVPVVESASPCDSLKPFTTFAALNACLSFQPYSSSLKQQTADSLLKTIPAYVFLDISRDSPDQDNIPMNVNLNQSIYEVANRDFGCDADLQEAFANVFVPLHDAHTGYRKTGYPYSSATFAQPFLLHSYVAQIDGAPTQALQVLWKDDWVSNFTAVYNITLPNVNGWRVSKLDGQDAVSYIISYANTSLGFSKDLGARYNLAVDGYTFGQWGVRPQTLLPRPTSGSVQWTLVDPDNSAHTVVLDIPWLGIWSPPAPSPTPSSRVKNMYQLMQEDMRRLDAQAPSPPETSAFLFNKHTGVVRIRDFNPADEGAATTQFITGLTQGLQQITSANVSNLIIDLRANGGGDICLGYAVLRFLFPSLSSSWAGKYDMRQNPLFDAFAQKGAQQMCQLPQNQTVCGVNPEVVGYFTPCAWMNTTFQSEWNVDATFHDDSWYFPGIKYTRGGITHGHTFPIHEACQETFNRFIPSGCYPSFSPDNTIVLSDGLCGSTCAVFSRHIQETLQAKTVVVGGIKDRPIGIASFPGGEVEDVNFLISLAQKYGLQGSNLVPAPIANNVTFRFAIREIYPFNGNTSLPLEFIFEPSDFHVDYPALPPNSTLASTKLESHTSISPLDRMIYAKTSQFFTVCASWGLVPCNFDNGTGAYLCVNGKYSPICSPLGCNPGHFLNDVGDCASCPAGTWKANNEYGPCNPCTNGGQNALYNTEAWAGPNNCPYICKGDYSGFLCDKDSSDSGDDSHVNLTTGWFVAVVIGVFFAAAVISFVAALFVFNRWFTRRADNSYLALNTET